MTFTSKWGRGGGGGGRLFSPVFCSLAFPLFAGPDVLTDTQAQALVDRLFAPDMMSAYGVKSTSSNDEGYNNEPTLTPYSNWQGPVWVVANAVIT